MGASSSHLAEGRFSLRLFTAFFAVALAFVGSSAYSNWLSVEIGFRARQVTESALPNAESLMAAVDDLRNLEAATDDYPELPPADRGNARQVIEDLWRRIDTELGAYQVASVLAGEHELFRDVPSSLRDLDVSMQHLFMAVDSGDHDDTLASSDRDVRTKANLSAALLRRLIQINTAQAAESSMRIEDTRRRVLVVDGILDGVLIVLTLGIAAWVWRVFQSYARLQRLHAELLERRADELELFSRRVAHDLLSPLVSLTFCLTAFKKVSDGDSALEGALARAGRCVQRAQLLVDNVFDFARSGGTPNDDTRVEVREVMAQVVEEARSVDPSERPEVVCGPVPDCAVRSSRGVLASILGNLVRNAIKFMRDSAQKRIEIRVVEGSEFVRFEVEDTGPGVAPGLERAIFEPYVRGTGVTQPGLGLGLATVKRFCEAHGGTVEVRSSLGLGSVFVFTLPRAADAVSGTAARASVPRIADAAR